MALEVQQPTDGKLQILGALVATPLPSGVTVQQPTAGELQILGAVVMGSLDDGNFVQQLPS